MTLLEKHLSLFPDEGGAVVVLSGGMDSSLSTMLSVKKYGKDNVHAITYYYKQKQSIEIQKAASVAKYLDIKRHVPLDISFLGDIVKNITSNVVGGVEVPNIKDVIGHPQPPTVVPNRNAILLSIAAAYAEANGLHSIVIGLQAQDQYSYWDTTHRFIESMNALLSCNRMFKLGVITPFINSNKHHEIQLCQEVFGSVEFLGLTLTCYNPNENGESCGKCQGCSERVMAFKKVHLKDPIPYSIDINWQSM